MTRSVEAIQDETLVLAAQAGDATAFEAILRRWLPGMRRHAFRLTNDTEAAEDVCQEACLALVRSLARLDDPACALGWMLRIVTNKSADWVRRRQRERQLNRAIQHREPHAIPSDLPNQTEAHERAALLRSACMDLPTELRAVISLYYGEGMSVAETAEALGSPAGTIKSRLHEARAQIKAILEGTQHEHV